MSNLCANLKHCKVGIAALVSVGMIIFANEAAAAGGTIGTMATQITGSFAQLTKLITAMSYLAGLGFMVGSIIKFKAHKDQPAQIPIGQPIGLMLVAAALLFLPSILNMAGNTLFGASGGKTAGPTGMTF